MKLLESHSAFEALLGRGDLAADPNYAPPALVIVYFTATWCGACQALNPDAIEAAVPEARWLKCDIDANSYTPGYCSVKSIPTFLAVGDRKVLAKLTSNDTQKVIRWAKDIHAILSDD